MFNLFKDIEKYKGITPYASEHYGVYQPILGWESKLTKNWIQRGGNLFDPRVKRILDGRILPGPQLVESDMAVNFLAVPLQPGSGKSPFRVILAKDLNSELLRLVRISVQTFVDNNNGRLPEDGEWNQLIEINNLMDVGKNGLLRQVNDIHRTRLNDAVYADGNRQITEKQIAVQKTHLELMQYESQIAAFLLFHAEGHSGFDPNELKKLFFVKVAPPLSEIFRSTDPLANIDPESKSGALSPVGFIHLYRQ